MDFGIMFFSSLGSGDGSKYDLLLETAHFADRMGFTSLWTPERHFHEFGGLFPNPAVTGAALAAITQRIHIRAGSLISPLHNPIRIAEDWSVVDNLSGGRVGISFGAGWNTNDFIISPNSYSSRSTVMYEQIDLVKRLWRGEAVVQTNGMGREVEVRTYPRPVQAELPIWITTSGNTQSFVRAGAIGANLLTHLLGQDVPALAANIERYRSSLEQNGFNRRSGTVSLMLHTFVGSDLGEVRSIVRAPFRAYLRDAIELEQRAAAGGGTMSGGHKVDQHEIPPQRMDELLDIAFDKYFARASLMGTLETCSRLLSHLESIGVDEVACLVDFGVEHSRVVESLDRLHELQRSCAMQARSSQLEIDLQTQSFLDDLEGS